MLLEEIAPRLRSAVPRVVLPVGAEDSEELVQDAIYTAAWMIDRVERGEGSHGRQHRLLHDPPHEVGTPWPR